MGYGNGPLKKLTFGVNHCQWLSIFWLVIQEQELERPDLGILERDRNRPGFEPFAKDWLQNDIGGGTAGNCGGQLVSLLRKARALQHDPRLGRAIGRATNACNAA